MSGTTNKHTQAADYTKKQSMFCVLCMCFMYVFVVMGCDTGASPDPHGFIGKGSMGRVGTPAVLGKNGCPSQELIAQTHEAEMFIAMHRDNGYDTQKPYQLWDKQYPHTVTCIPQTESGVFTLIVNQIKLGAMPLTMAAYFPRVRIIRLDNYYSFRTEEKGFAFFFSSELDPAQSTALSYLQKQARMHSKTVLINPYQSELKIKNGSLCFKIALDWGISFESLITDGKPETQAMKETARDMYTSVKSITGSKGNYTAVFDPVKDKYSGNFYLKDK